MSKTPDEQARELVDRHPHLASGLGDRDRTWPVIAAAIRAAVAEAVSLIYASWDEATDMGGDTDFSKLVERIEGEMPWIFDEEFRAAFCECFEEEE